MGVDIKVNTKTTRNKVTGCLLSEMEGSTKENGRMANNMEEEYSVRKMSADKAFGKTASELNGVTKPSKIKQLSDLLMISSVYHLICTNNLHNLLFIFTTIIIAN